MYKIFLNDRKIVIATPDQLEQFSHYKVVENMLTVADVKSWFALFAHETDSDAIFLHANPDALMRSVFSPAFKMIEAAGGVVKRNEKWLFIFRCGKWDLPKGKIDFGETPEQAAIREVTEECGITGQSIEKQLSPTFHIYQSPYKNDFGQWILKKTYWFEMRYSGKENGTPETGENISEIRWVERQELGEILENTYKNLLDLFLKYSF